MQHDTLIFISAGESEFFFILTTGSGPFHSWVRAFSGRSLAVLEFASGRVDRKGADNIEPLNMFMNISWGGGQTCEARESNHRGLRQIQPCMVGL